jgi:hypothetical protein
MIPRLVRQAVRVPEPTATDAAGRAGLDAALVRAVYRSVKDD